MTFCVMTFCLREHGWTDCALHWRMAYRMCIAVDGPFWSRNPVDNGRNLGMETSVNLGQLCFITYPCSQLGYQAPAVEIGAWMANGPVRARGRLAMGHRGSEEPILHHG